MRTVAAAQMPPQQQAVAFVQLHVDCCANRQQNLGGYMAVRQTGDDGRARLAAQPLHHGLQAEALVVRGFFIFGELPQQNRLLPVEYASMQ